MMRFRDRSSLWPLLPTICPELGAAVSSRVIAPRRLSAWVPSAILMLGLLVLILTKADNLLNDPDVLWHVEIGRWIVAHGAVPWTDTYSHTFFGAPWIAKEWLSQLILYVAHRLAGWWGVTLVAALSISSAFAILHEWLRRRVHPLVALAATLFAALLACPHFLARPHVLVLPVIVLWMTGLLTALDRRAPPPLSLALLMALWANMHGSFPLGLVMAGVLAGEGILLPSPVSRLANLRGWTVFLALSLMATALSPYGWHAILVPLLMSGNAETLRFISEWQPLQFDVVGSLALGLLALTLAVLCRDAAKNLFRIVCVALLAYLMIRHVRFVSLFAIIAPLLVAKTLTTRKPIPKPPTKPRLSQLDASMVQGSLLTALVVMAGMALALAAIMRPTPEPRYAPEAALHFARTHGVLGPVYNDYDFGGFLMANEVPTFIDGRTDQLFLGDFLPSLDRAIKADRANDFASLMSRHHVRWALVRSGSRATTQLAALPGWSRVYQDGIASIYVAPVR